MDALIPIFTLVADPKSWIGDAITIFCRSSSEPASGAILRKVRAERRALVEPRYSAEESKRQAEEKLRQVNSALDKAHGSSRRIVKRERKKRRKAAWKAAQQLLALSGKERHLEARVTDLETSFARQELFRFLKSKRYTLTPLNLANAAAGLPYMGWRQSMRRNFKVPCVLANGTRYQVFKAISYLARATNKKTENALVTSFRDGILSLPRRYQGPKVELADKWLYLDRAIRQAYRSKPHRKALVCEITKRYFKQIRSQSEVDMVLAEQAKLTLSVRPKRITSSQQVKPDTGTNKSDKIMKASK